MKLDAVRHADALGMSPSMRREWIEISSTSLLLCSCVSPSMRREWIEMCRIWIDICGGMASPSMRREWIEMESAVRKPICLHGLPPCGGSGLKFFIFVQCKCQFVVSLHAEGVD